MTVKPSDLAKKNDKDDGKPKKRRVLSKHLTHRPFADSEALMGLITSAAVPNKRYTKSKKRVGK